MHGDGALARSVVFVLQSELTARVDGELRQSLIKLDAALTGRGLTVTKYFAGMFLVSKVSQIEQYFVDVVRVISTHYPKKLGSNSFKLADVLESTTEELVARAAEQYINNVMYKKPSEYQKDLAEFLSIDADAIGDKWLPFIEMKLCRDLGIHNEWVVNDTYLRKLREAKIPSSLKVGETVCPDIDSLMTIFSQGCELVNAISAELERAYKPAAGK